MMYHVSLPKYVSSHEVFVRCLHEYCLNVTYCYEMNLFHDAFGCEFEFKMIVSRKFT